MWQEDLSNSKKDDLLCDLDDALSKQRSKCMSGFGLAESKENHYQSHIHHRLNELEGYYFIYTKYFIVLCTWSPYVKILVIENLLCLDERI